MPPRREVIWDEQALGEYRGLLQRRKHKDEVRQCVEAQILAVADNVELARPWDGPLGFLRIYRFECKDGDSGLYVQLEVEALDTSLIILSCNTVRY
jgi:succinate dehydrogenase/fumarate reductase-like Fe-S protein